MIANIARYHRKALPKESHSDYMSLSETNRETVDEMSAILRLADGLDRGYERRVGDLEIHKTGNQIELVLISSQNVKAEIHAIKMKKEGFERAFNCTLKVSHIRPN